MDIGVSHGGIKMSLFVCVADDKGDYIVLNKEYKNKPEQIREKLLQNHAKELVNYILKVGRYIDEPCVKKVYVPKKEARLTTHVRSQEALIVKTQTIVIYPDSRWRNATFLEKLTKKVNDGMWGSVVCTWIIFSDNKVMTFFSNKYDKKEIEEHLCQRRYSKEIVNEIMQAGRYHDYPQLIELSATKEECGMVKQYLEGQKETRTKAFRRKRWIVVYPNAFWRFATWKEIMSGTVLG